MRLSRRALTAERLAEAIGRATTRAPRDKAASLRPLIEAEQGVESAIDTLEGWGLLR